MLSSVYVVRIVSLIISLAIVKINTQSCPYQCSCDKDEHTNTLTVSCQTGDGLTEVPSGIPNDTNILQLDNNNFTTLKNDSFKSFKSLQVLTHGSCNMQYIPDNLFGGLVEISLLNLEKNKISQIGLNVFKGLINLKELILSNNCLTHVPDGIFSDLANLEYLKLDKNDFDGSLSPFVFEDLVSLLELELDRNSFDIIVDRTFSSLSKLRKLDLGHNSIDIIGNKSFSGLRSIQHLKVKGQGNNAWSLPSDIFHELDTLVHLEISYNNFDYVESKLFKNLLSLKILEMKDIGVENVSNGMFNGLYELTDLDLRGNHIRILTTDTFSGLSAMKILLLNDNFISQVYLSFFRHMSLLNKLSLNGNPIECDYYSIELKNWLIVKIASASGIKCDDIPSPVCPSNYASRFCSEPPKLSRVYQPINIIKVQSLIECAIKCQSNVNCNAIDYRGTQCTCLNVFQTAEQYVPELANLFQRC